MCEIKLTKEKEKTLKRFCSICNRQKSLGNFWNDKCKSYLYSCKKCRDKD